MNDTDQTEPGMRFDPQTGRWVPDETLCRHNRLICDECATPPAPAPWGAPAAVPVVRVGRATPLRRGPATPPRDPELEWLDPRNEITFTPDEPDEDEGEDNDGPAGDFLNDYWFNYGGPDEPSDPDE